MAPDVRKTYTRHFRRNLSKALDLLEGDGAEDTAKALIEAAGAPTYGDNQAFRDALLKLLDEKYGAENGKKLCDFAFKYAALETDRSTYQAMEALVHNLNTMHSRAGAQIPFSSLNYGTDTSPEGRLVMKCLLDATDAGLGHGETPIFPIQIFKVKEGVNYNPGDPNYDLFKLACKVSAKRLFPNFSFLDAPFKKVLQGGGSQHQVAYMGCRTRVIANVYDPTREVSAGRGNLSFTSINLPRLAIEARGSTDRFFESLDSMIALVIEQLLARFKIQSGKKVRNYPFLMGEGIWLDSDKLGPDDTVGEVLKHGTLTIGFIGLAEALKALVGAHHGESPDSQNLGLEIIGFIRRRIDEASEKYGLNFSVIATPAEGLSGRSFRLDKSNTARSRSHRRDYYSQLLPRAVYYPIGSVRQDPHRGAVSRADQRRTHHLLGARRQPARQPVRV